MEINISKKDFWKTIKPELAYFNKKWTGDSDAEKRENERTVLLMYYDSLCYSTQYALEIAFKRHRQSETTFPKIPQLVKFITKPSDTYQTKSYKREPMPDKVAEIFNNPVVSDSMKLASANMIHQRFNTTFAECRAIVGLEVMK